jgi:hypothetical protein
MTEGVGGARPAAAELDRAPPAAGLFAAAVFASAALVFTVEPMVAKLVLPLLGGSPAVWNTSLAFFQAALLVGYLYAHLLQGIGSLRRQALIHGAVLIAAALVLPLKISQAFGDPGATQPGLWLLGVLLASVGAPFAALSATAPLVQAWYARSRPTDTTAHNPYVLYAASNLGSLLALLAYPVIIEPNLHLKTQTVAWTLGYGGFALLMAAVAVVAWRADGSSFVRADAAADERPTTWAQRLTWVALAALPSSLMLGVTTHITTDVGSAPFLWVAPLALYLLTFIIAFQTRPLISPINALLFQAAAALGCFYTLGLSIGVVALQVLLHLAAFFFTALMCHQALAARRPQPARLTEFYLLMSLGGVIGGAFNAFAAPLIFKTVLEYPLVLGLACLVRPWGRGWPSRRETAFFLGALIVAAVALMLRDPEGPAPLAKLLMVVTIIVGFLLRDRAWAFLALCIVLAFTSQQLDAAPNVLKTERGFFGVLRLIAIDPPELGRARYLTHGSTMHGAEAEAPAQRCRPLVYYAPSTPIGQVFRSVEARKPAIRAGAIGMGAGTVATYTRPGDSLRFFEIDPQVIAMATDPAYFSYIKGCARGRIDWVVGDARLKLAHEPADEFDILLVDAFSSDSVPTHLLTVEAMRGYLSRIKPDGVVIMHLSSRNLELMSPVAGVAWAACGAALEQYYVPNHPVLLTDPTEDVIIVARSEAALAPYRSDPRWSPAQSHGVRVWTDDYTDLFGALVRRVAQLWGLAPGR